MILSHGPVVALVACTPFKVLHPLRGGRHFRSQPLDIDPKYVLDLVQCPVAKSNTYPGFPDLAAAQFFRVPPGSDVDQFARATCGSAKVSVV